MAHFVLLTKTQWDEPPRLRHQLAMLLAEAGHEVIFFEKPRPFWRRVPAPRKVHERITLVGCRELVHHKLRLLPLLHRLNAHVVVRSLRAGLRLLGMAEPYAIINFNYEYYFVGDLAGDDRVITVINDDHTATALFGWQRPLLWALRRTCAASARVLTVSRPLVGKLQPFCQPELLWPWADRAYNAPAPGTRDILLFWGYINDRLDFDLLSRLADEAPERRLLLVGPQQRGVAGDIARLAERENVEFRGPTPLDELPMRRVLAGLIPYRSGSARIDAIELSNKALRLLADGLPLLISGMPQFVAAPFVLRLDGADTPAAVVARAERDFFDLQGAIRAFVDANGATARLRQLMGMTQT